MCPGAADTRQETHPYSLQYRKTSKVRIMLTFKGREARGPFQGRGNLLPFALDPGYMAVKLQSSISCT